MRQNSEIQVAEKTLSCQDVIFRSITSEIHYGKVPRITQKMGHLDLISSIGCTVLTCILMNIELIAS